MSTPQIVNREQWLAAREAMLAREKEHTHLADELASARRELPWLPVDKDYTLQTAAGPRTLAELFDGRSQLVIYHFMFGPDYEHGCPVCSSIADSFNGVLEQLKARDTTMIAVSQAPVDKLEAEKERLGWSFTWPPATRATSIPTSRTRSAVSRRTSGSPAPPRSSPRTRPTAGPTRPGT